MKALADEQGGFYREIGIFLRPATGSGLGGAPCGERLFGEPNRNIATLASQKRLDAHASALSQADHRLVLEVELASPESSSRCAYQGLVVAAPALAQQPCHGGNERKQKRPKQTTPGTGQGV